MTAHVVNSPSTISVASKGTAKSAPQDSAATPFKHQLHAAQQEHSAGAHERDHAREMTAQRGTDNGRDRRRDNHSSVGSQAHDRRANATESNKNQAAPQTESDAASTTTNVASTDLSAASSALAAEVAPMRAGSAITDETIPTEKTTDGSDQGAAALIGAMLAMIGPAAGKVLASGATSSQASRPAAGDRGAAALLSVAANASVGANADPSSIAMPVPLLAADSLAADSADMRAAAAADSASVVALAASAPPSSGAPSAPVTIPLASPAGTHAFTQELSQQVAWCVSHDVKQARIRLHPEELGSLDLKISVSHGRVDVSFQAQHPGAVTALQQSLPQLGQMLAQHGLSLGNAEVGQQHSRGDHRGEARADGDGAEIAEIQGTNLVTPAGQIVLLDAFA